MYASDEIFFVCGHFGICLWTFWYILLQDPFDPIDFVEHLMQSVISKQKRKEVLGEAKPQGGGTKVTTPSKGKELHGGDGFDAQALLSVFDDTLYELGGLSERVERRVEKLMKVIQKEERETKAGVSTVEKAFEVRKLRQTGL